MWNNPEAFVFCAKWRERERERDLCQASRKMATITETGFQTFLIHEYHIEGSRPEWFISSMIYSGDGGRNSSVGSAWARCPQRRGFDPPLGTFSGRGDFSLGVNMGSNSIPPRTPSDESINRGLVCAHMHFIARTQKILTFMS